MYKLHKILSKEVTIYEPEFELNETVESEGSIEVFVDEEGIYRIEGSKVNRMLGFTNLEDDKGFVFFQNFLKENGILDKLEELGIEEGDTVAVFNLQFEYYK